MLQKLTPVLAMWDCDPQQRIQFPWNLNYRSTVTSGKHSIYHHSPSWNSKCDSPSDHQTRISNNLIHPTHHTFDHFSLPGVTKRVMKSESNVLRKEQCNGLVNSAKEHTSGFLTRTNLTIFKIDFSLKSQGLKFLKWVTKVSKRFQKPDLWKSQIGKFSFFFTCRIQKVIHTPSKKLRQLGMVFHNVDYNGTERFAQVFIVSRIFPLSHRSLFSEMGIFSGWCCF